MATLCANLTLFFKEQKGGAARRRATLLHSSLKILNIFVQENTE